MRSSGIRITLVWIICCVLFAGCSDSPKSVKADDLCIEVREVSSLAAEGVVLVHLLEHDRITRPYFRAYSFEASEEVKSTLKSLKKERGVTDTVEQSRLRIMDASRQLHTLFTAMHDRKTSQTTEAQFQGLKQQLLHEKEQLCKS